MTATTKQMFRVTINAPVQQVWDTLTRRDELLPFFFNSVLETPGLQPGAPIRMRTLDGKHTGVVGDVLEFEPPHRYSHTFRFTNFNDPVCKVTYDLKPIEGGTEFTLTSEDVPVGTKTEKQMGFGTKFIAKTLKQVVENGRPSFMGRLFLGLIKLSKAPEVCLSSHWPFDRDISATEKVQQ